MQWNTNAFVGTILVVSLIIISIVKPGGIIEEKLLPMENLMQEKHTIPLESA